MALETATEQNFGAKQIGEGLSRAGLPYDHPIRQVLEENATIVGGRDPAVRVNGRSVDDAISELRKDPKYAGTFEPAPKTIDHNDMKTMSSHFDAIRTGKIVVN